MLFSHEKSCDFSSHEKKLIYFSREIFRVYVLCTFMLSCIWISVSRISIFQFSNKFCGSWIIAVGTQHLGCLGVFPKVCRKLEIMLIYCWKILSIIIFGRFWDGKDRKIKEVSFPGNNLVPESVAVVTQHFTNIWGVLGLTGICVRSW